MSNTKQFQTYVWRDIWMDVRTAVILYASHCKWQRHKNRTANSAGPDETARNKPSHQDLHCFQRYLFWCTKPESTYLEKFGLISSKCTSYSQVQLLSSINRQCLIFIWGTKAIHSFLDICVCNCTEMGSVNCLKIHMAGLWNYL